MANNSQFDEIEEWLYVLEAIVHSNFEVTKVILGLVAQNTYRNAGLIELKYWSKFGKL